MTFLTRPAILLLVFHFRLLLLLLLVNPATAQQQQQITWSSVIYTFHGEETPVFVDGPYELTPLGAHQLVNAGTAIRNRYIDPPSGDAQSIAAAPINGISVAAIDNTQLYVQATDDVVVSASALAFLQGLYPPASAGREILGNSSALMYPFGGYQYPMITTLSQLDFNFIWIAGYLACPAYDIDGIEVLASRGYQDQIARTQSFYDSLAGSLFGDIQPSIINYGSAYNLYEYALYQYNHNQTVFKTLAPADLAGLFNLASQQQFEMNTPNSHGTIAAISGQTLASKILQQFNLAIGSSGSGNKITALFGSFEPILAFFALSNLSVSVAASQFISLPLHGSSLAFELFSYTSPSAGSSSSNVFPSVEDLWVRFLFRNGTEETAQFISYPLFGRGNSETDMTWTDFADGMGDFALSKLIDWCNVCSASTLFCEAINANSKGPPAVFSDPYRKTTLSPTVAGVIGAFVALAVLGLAGLALVLLGLRFRFREKGNAPQLSDIHVLSKNSNGGFKGAEKLASDTDLTLKGGAGATVIRHERVGSWELGEPGQRRETGSLDKEVGGKSKRTVSGVDYGRKSEDGIGNVNPFGDPVSPLDQV